MRTRPFAGEFVIVAMSRELAGRLRMTRPQPWSITVTRQRPGQQPVENEVILTTTTLPSGGIRFWLLCPRCGRRALNLYAKGASGELACRVCARFVYKSQYFKSKMGQLTWLTGEWLRGTLKQRYESRLNAAIEWFNRIPRPKSAVAVADFLRNFGLPNLFEGYPRKPAP